MNCSPLCIHHDISDDLYSAALKHQEDFKKQMGSLDSHKNRIWNKQEDVIGSLAQSGAIEWLQSQPGAESINADSYHVDGQYGDKGDFFWRDQWTDVKGSPMATSYPNVTPYSRLLVSAHQRKKVVDNYLFVKVDLEHMQLHIVGIIGYQKFWDLNQVFQSPRMKHPCNYILVNQSQSVRHWLYGS